MCEWMAETPANVAVQHHPLASSLAADGARNRARIAEQCGRGESGCGPDTALSNLSNRNSGIQRGGPTFHRDGRGDHAHHRRRSRRNAQRTAIWDMGEIAASGDRGALDLFRNACYRPGGCADIIEAVATHIDARQFNASFPKVFPRFVQHAIWRYCSLSGLDVCNGNRIDDSRRCENKDCRVRLMCDRVALH